MIIGINMAGTIVGPAFAGWVFDTFSSYQFAWLPLAALSIVAVLFTLGLRPIRLRT